MQQDLMVCGWRLRSNIPLGELEPWRGDDRGPDLVVTCKSCMDSRLELGTLKSTGPILTQGSTDGTWRLRLPGVGVFSVREGKYIEVDILSTADMGDIPAFILGPVLAACCAQRRLLALQGSAVGRGDCGIGIFGDPGVGKSAAALLMTSAGFDLVSDGLTVLEVVDSCAPMLRPTHPWFQIWRRAALGFDLPIDGAAKYRSCLEKYKYRYMGNFDGMRTFRLTHVFVLQQVRDVQKDDDAAGVAVDWRRLLRSMPFRQGVEGGMQHAEATAMLQTIASAAKVFVVDADGDSETASRILQILS